RLLHRGNEELEKQAALARLVHLAPKSRMRTLTQAIAGSYRLLLAAASLSPGGSSPARRQLAAQCEAAARALQHGYPLAPAGAHPDGQDDLSDVRDALARLAPEAAPRSEERRVGKECRARRWAYCKKKERYFECSLPRGDVVSDQQSKGQRY